MKETLIQSLGWEDPLEKGLLPPPIFLPGEFHEERILAEYSPWALKELAMIEKIPLYFIEWTRLFQASCMQQIIQFTSVAHSCPILCDPMDCIMPVLPLHHQLPEFTETHVH